MLDDQKDFINSESIAYPFTALIADIGGATGLFLGVSVIACGFNITFFINFADGNNFHIFT